MKKIVWPLAAVALVAAIGFKIAADMPKAPVYLAPVPSHVPSATPSATPRPSAAPLNEASAAYAVAVARAAEADKAVDVAAKAYVEAAAIASAEDPSYGRTVADAVARALCTGTLSISFFSPDSGVDQDTIDRHSATYASEHSTCDEVSFLGDVVQPDRTDFIYRVVTKGKANWYIFTIADGLVTNIQ